MKREIGLFFCYFVIAFAVVAVVISVGFLLFRPNLDVNASFSDSSGNNCTIYLDKDNYSYDGYDCELTKEGKDYIIHMREKK